jgi:hypothetical protein
MASNQLSTTELYGRDILSAAPRRRATYVRNAVAHWRGSGFPYARLGSREVYTNYAAVARAPMANLEKQAALGSSCVGLRLVNSYHPQMWHARSHRHSKSPYDYFQLDDHLHAMLQRAPRFWPNTRCWSAQAVRNLARIYAGGRVANFRPVIARQVINHFSGNGDVVLDFSAGYGGRLLACLTLDRS